MKKLISILAFFGILIITFYCISADYEKKAYGKNNSMPGEESGYSPFSYIDSARYFPLKIGNKYYYKYKYTFHRSVPDSTAYDSSYYIMRITDTVRYNGKLYYKMNSVFNLPANYEICYFRHDLDSGYFIKYDSTNWCTYTPYEVKCFMLRSLLNQIGTGNCWLNNFYSRCIEINDTTAFGSQRKVKVFQVIWGGTTGGSYTSYLLKDIGMCQYTHYNYNLGPATYETKNYKLIGAYVDGVKYGDTNTVGIISISGVIPDRFELYQNYPNPFNPSTIIKFSIPENGKLKIENGIVMLKIYDILGREIKTLVNEKLNPGTYEVTFDGSNLQSGVYYYRLTAGNFSETKKLLLLK